MIYLAIPYSDPSGAVRMQRFHLANLVTAILIQRGHVVFSPISHSHVVAQYLTTPKTSWDFWKQQDLPMLDACDKIVVICQLGWKDSVGVQAEIKHALETGKEIIYLYQDPAFEWLFEEELESEGL